MSQIHSRIPLVLSGLLVRSTALGVALFSTANAAPLRALGRPVVAMGNGGNVKRYPSCSLTIGTKKQCGGLMHASAASNPAALYADYIGSQLQFERSITRPRKLKNPASGTQDCVSPALQLGDAWINKQGRGMVLKNLPSSTLVIVGAIKFKKNCPGDSYYDVGANQPDEGDDRRYLVVVSHDTGNPDPTNARWQFYQVGVVAGVTGLHSRGVIHNIVQCSTDHQGDKEVSSADFWGCDRDHRANRIARDFRISMADVRMLSSCTVTGAEGCLPATVLDTRMREFHRLPDQQKRKLRVALDDFVRTQAPETDPYWFTCALGCCTAAM